MVSGREEGAAKGPIGPEDIEGLPVYGSGPAIGVEDLAENCHAVLRCGVAVADLVGGVGGHLDGSARNGGCHARHRPGVYNGLCAEIHLADEGNLFVRRGGGDNAVGGYLSSTMR